MTKPTTDQVQQWAAEAGFPPHIRAAGAGRELDRLAVLAYAAGQAAERDKMPQAPMIVYASKIDMNMNKFAEIMKRAGPPAALVAVSARPDDIEVAVADEREAIIAQLLALGALEDGDFITAIRARSAKEKP